MSEENIQLSPEAQALKDDAYGGIVGTLRARFRVSVAACYDEKSEAGVHRLHAELAELRAADNWSVACGVADALEKLAR